MNAFVGRTKVPTEGDLAEALGRAKPIWDRLQAEIARELNVVDREWKSYSPKFGWALRLKRGKRNIVHLSPCRGGFAVLLILGDRAVRAARAGRLGSRAMRLLDEAPHYPEGTGVRIDVKGTRDIPLIKKLARIKLEN